MATPDYYANMVNDPFSVMQQVPGLFECWCIGSIIKYSMRAGKKDGEPAIEDLKKAADYAQRLLVFTDRPQEIPF